jgi:hypothetical protein
MVSVEQARATRDHISGVRHRGDIARRHPRARGVGGLDRAPRHTFSAVLGAVTAQGRDNAETQRDPRRTLRPSGPPHENLDRTVFASGSARRTGCPVPKDLPRRTGCDLRRGILNGNRLTVLGLERGRVEAGGGRLCQRISLAGSSVEQRLGAAHGVGIAHRATGDGRLLRSSKIQ